MKRYMKIEEHKPVTDTLTALVGKRVHDGFPREIVIPNGWRSSCPIGSYVDLSDHETLRVHPTLPQ